jgi:cellulose 1,4-beta-cellobiosidase
MGMQRSRISLSLRLCAKALLISASTLHCSSTVNPGGGAGAGQGGGNAGQGAAAGRDGGGGSASGTGGSTSGTGGTASGTGGSASGNGGKGGSGGSGGGSVDAGTTGNPFAGASFYLNPDYARKVQSSMELAPADAPLLAKMKGFSTAVWLDRIAAVSSVAGHLDAALAQQNATGKPTVSVFVVYDLPNRDCHAKASNGELRLNERGLERYKNEFIAPIAAAFKAHPKQRIVAVIEPDSLPNLATNMSDPNCATAEPGYREGVAHALKTLAAPHVFMYLDTGHAGWLGWPDNQSKAAAIFAQVLQAAGGSQLIRGFASNVANYNVLHETKELFDYQGNPCRDELSFASQFANTLRGAGVNQVAWLIDTSRNGVGGIRHQWGYWCNNKGAGVGTRPVASPQAGIDAYYWVKPPGESDGTSDPSAVRFDAFCGYEDAAQGAPEAGQWFHSYFVDAVKRANPPL